MGPDREQTLMKIKYKTNINITILILESAGMDGHI